MNSCLKKILIDGIVILYGCLLEDCGRLCLVNAPPWCTERDWTMMSSLSPYLYLVWRETVIYGISY